MNNKILACGVPRTGSTLIWQILLRALPNHKVVKAHPASWAVTNGWYIIGSVRHPYDIAASCFRARIAGDSGDGSQETVVGTKKGLVSELNMMNNNFKVLRELINKYPGVILRYEDFFNNFDVVFNMIEKNLGQTIPPKMKRFIRNDCSFETNQKRSCSDIRGKEYQKTKINRAHVGIGTPGTWKTVIPLWGYDVMKKWCDPLCKEWGYENKY